MLRLPALVMMLFLSAPALAVEPVPDYASLVEPDDRLDVHAKPLLDRLAADPGDEQARMDLVELYRRHGDFERGLAEAELLAKTRPDDRKLLEARADMAGMEIEDASIFNKPSLAKKLASLCEAESRRDPANVMALQCLARFHLQAPSVVGGDKAKAEAAIAAVEPLDPAGHLMLRAEQAFASGDGFKGMVILGEALPRLTTASPAVGIGLRRLNGGDLSGAVEAFDKATSLDPDLPFLLYQLGRTSAVTGERLELGRDALIRFLGGSAWMGGTNYRPAAHWRLGMIFEAMGDEVQAEKAYRRVLELDPRHKEAKVALKKLR